MSTLRTVAGLGPRRWAVLLHATLAATVVEVAIRALRLPAASRLAGATLRLEADAPSVPPSLGEVEEADGWDLLSPWDADRCELALRVLDRGPFNGTCLRQSLLLAHLLRRRDPVLRVGVAKVGGSVQAHAWIEIDGASLDPTRSEFHVLTAPVPGGAA